MSDLERKADIVDSRIKAVEEVNHAVFVLMHYATVLGEPRVSKSLTVLLSALFTRINSAKQPITTYEDAHGKQS